MKTLLLMFVIAQGADLGTTLVNLDKGCRELNPLYQGPTVRVIATKVGVTFGIGATALILHKKGHKRQAKLILIAGALAAGGAAIWNTSVTHLCGG